MLLPKVAETLCLEEYSRARYDESVAETPRFDGDSEEEAKKARNIVFEYCVVHDESSGPRKDRMSMASGLEVRVPFLRSQAG